MTRIIGLLCALALSCAACAQSGKVYRIGVLEIRPANGNQANFDAFLKGMREAGFVEGKNIVIDYRSSDGQSDRFPALAVDLVRAKPDVILTRGTAAALAAKDAGSISVVMAAAADPVGNGIVASLARPGGHVTGLTAILSELGPKRVEILKELVPRLSKVGVALTAWNTSGGSAQWREIQRAAHGLGIETVRLPIHTVGELNGVYDEVRKRGIGALVAGADVVSAPDRQRALIDLAAKHKLPVIYATRQTVELGGLMSYGVHYPDLYYHAASYVAKILKGAKPADLPIEQPTKFEFVINLKTASALGITIPRELLLRADEVIQ